METVAPEGAQLDDDPEQLFSCASTVSLADGVQEKRLKRRTSALSGSEGLTSSTGPSPPSPTALPPTALSPNARLQGKAPATLTCIDDGSPTWERYSRARAAASAANPLASIVNPGAGPVVVPGSTTTPQRRKSYIGFMSDTPRASLTSSLSQTPRGMRRKQSVSFGMASGTGAASETASPCATPKGTPSAVMTPPCKVSRASAALVAQGEHVMASFLERRRVVKRLKEVAAKASADYPAPWDGWFAAQGKLPPQMQFGPPDGATATLVFPLAPLLQGLGLDLDEPSLVGWRFGRPHAFPPAATEAALPAGAVLYATKPSTHPARAPWEGWYLGRLKGTTSPRVPPTPTTPFSLGPALVAQARKRSTAADSGRRVSLAVDVDVVDDCTTSAGDVDEDDGMGDMSLDNFVAFGDAASPPSRQTSAAPSPAFSEPTPRTLSGMDPAWRRRSTLLSRRDSTSAMSYIGPDAPPDRVRDWVAPGDVLALMLEDDSDVEFSTAGGPAGGFEVDTDGEDAVDVMWARRIPPPGCDPPVGLHELLHDLGPHSCDEDSARPLKHYPPPTKSLKPSPHRKPPTQLQRRRAASMHLKQRAILAKLGCGTPESSVNV